MAIQHLHPSGGRSKAAPGEPLRFVKEVAAKYVGDQCLFWPFGKSRSGYGAVYVDKRQRSSHVLVCEIVRGPSPDPKYEVAHDCGNKLC
jgi:hypothetical protein